MANKKFSEFTLKTDSANVDFVVGYDGSDNVRIAPSNLSTGLPTTGGTMTGNLDVTDAAKIRLGTGLDMEIFHNGSQSYIESYTGEFNITQHANDGIMRFKCDDGSGGTSTYIQLDGSGEKISVSASNGMQFGDNTKLKIGAGNDLEIYHDGSDSYIDETGTGSLYIKSASAIRLQSDTGENMIYAQNDGAVNIYYNNVNRLQTTSAGANVTGTLDTDNLTIAGAQGSDGQVLTSTGSGVAWEDASGGGATSLNGLTDCLVDTASLYVGEVPSGLSGNPQGNTILGNSAGTALTTGTLNTFIGDNAGKSITTIHGTTAIGNQAAKTQNNESYGTYIGYAAGRDCTGSQQTMIGGNTRCYNSGGDSSGMVAVGYNAQDIKGGSYCTSVGYDAGASNEGANTVSIGRSSNRTNTQVGITSVGYQSGYSQTSGLGNHNFGYQAGFDNTTSNYRTLVGYEAGEHNTGGNNTFVGYEAGTGASGSSTGGDNTLMGYQAGTAITSAERSVAVGSSALATETASDRSVAIGAEALKTQNIGSGNSYNVAVGDSAGEEITTGDLNTIVGGLAGDSITTGNKNVAIGYQALSSANIALGSTVAIGYQAGLSAAAGNNIHIGAESGVSNSGNGFIGVGLKSGYSNTSGSWNTTLGYFAAYTNTTGAENTTIGTEAGYNNTGTGNTFLGYQAGYNQTTGSNNTVIGHDAEPSAVDVSNEITIGDANITHIRCQVQTISALSDKRDKTNIKDSFYGLDLINSLKPVTFDWNMRDGAKVGQKDLGFIAQDLQEVDDENLQLVYESNPEKLEASYGRLIPVLVKAIQDLSAKVTELENK